MAIVCQQGIRSNDEWRLLGPPLREHPDLILVFGGAGVLANDAWIDEIRRLHPRGRMVACSTAGEIIGSRVYDDTLSFTAVRFAQTRVAVESVSIDGPAGSRAAGTELARRLPLDGLAHVLVFSDGIHVNGSQLVAGILAELPADVCVTGGLAGDGDRMTTTYVGVDGPARPGTIAAVGLYGPRLRVGYGSLGGWDPFGPERLITRADGPVLHELDNQSALALYKRYLGEHAAGLPATALMFPLSVRSPSGSQRIVRTILGVDEAAETLTFAGDMPVGHYARLMRANFDRLVDGAYGAAARSLERGAGAELALLVSCVGRRLVLKQRVEEELESVREVLGTTPVCGFYSYGELCPTGVRGCDLHNQTMTVTTLAES